MQNQSRYAKSRDAVIFFRRKSRGTITCATSILLLIYSPYSYHLLPMSLRDLACYTLTLKPHEQDPKVTELVSAENGREEHRFARVREVKDDEAYSSSIYGTSSMQSSNPISYITNIKVKGSTYGLHDSSSEIGLTIDALTGAKLASVGYISEKQKNRRLQLHNPDESVGFDNTSKL